MASWPGVVRIALQFSRSYGDPMVNVLHVERDPTSSPPVALEIDAVLAATRDALWVPGAGASSLRALTDDDVTLASIVGTSMDVANAGLQRTLTVNQAGTGTGTHQELSPQLAPVVSHRTAVASRRARGRTYIAGIAPLAVVTSSAAYPVLTAAAQTSLQAAFDGWRTALAALTVPYFHVIASVPGATTYPVSQSVARLNLFTQRRRGPRGNSF